MKEIKKMKAENVKVFDSDNKKDEKKSARESDNDMKYIPETPPHM